MKLIAMCNGTVFVGKISKGSSSLPDLSPDDFQDRKTHESRSYTNTIFI